MTTRRKRRVPGVAGRRNVELVLAIELLAGAQAVDYRKPLRPGRGVERAHELIRSTVKHRDVDEEFSEDINAALEIIESGKLVAAAEQELGSLH